MTFQPKPRSIKLPCSESELGYLAGMIDAEGSIFLRSGTAAGPSVQIVNTDERLIQWLSGMGGVVSEKKDNSRKDHYKKCWRWRVSARNDVRALLEAVFDRLIVKRERAKEVLDLLA